MHASAPFSFSNPFYPCGWSACCEPKPLQFPHNSYFNGYKSFSSFPNDTSQSHTVTHTSPGSYQRPPVSTKSTYWRPPTSSDPLSIYHGARIKTTANDGNDVRARSGSPTPSRAYGSFHPLWTTPAQASICKPKRASYLEPCPTYAEYQHAPIQLPCSIPPPLLGNSFLNNAYAPGTCSAPFRVPHRTQPGPLLTNEIHTAYTPTRIPSAVKRPCSELLPSSQSSPQSLQTVNRGAQLISGTNHATQNTFNKTQGVLSNEEIRTTAGTPHKSKELGLGAKAEMQGTAVAQLNALKDEKIALSCAIWDLLQSDIMTKKLKLSSPNDLDLLNSIRDILAGDDVPECLELAAFLPSYLHCLDELMNVDAILNDIHTTTKKNLLKALTSPTGPPSSPTLPSSSLNSVGSPTFRSPIAPATDVEDGIYNAAVWGNDSNNQDDSSVGASSATHGSILTQSDTSVHYKKRIAGSYCWPKLAHSQSPLSSAILSPQSSCSSSSSMDKYERKTLVRLRHGSTSNKSGSSQSSVKRSSDSIPSDTYSDNFELSSKSRRTPSRRPECVPPFSNIEAVGTSGWLAGKSTAGEFFPPQSPILLNVSCNRHVVENPTPPTSD